METKSSENYPLLKEIQLGPHLLRNRIVMSAMTRCRADYGTCAPNDLHVTYYSERAENAGLTLTECCGVSQRGNCYPGACGIWTEEQVEGWTKVCEAVHKVNGKIFLQIWHCGRTARSEFIGDVKPLGPSPIQSRQQTHTKAGTHGLYDEPEEMTEDDIKNVLEEFRTGAKNALRAGFDGIELHGANGYIIDQFLRDSTNKRQDNYGGSVENRCRFPLEVMDVLIEVFGADRVGIKISPIGRFNDMMDSDPVPLFSHLLKELDKRKVCFVEVVGSPDGLNHFYDIKGEDQIPNCYETFRPCFSGTLIANQNFSFESGNKIVEEKLADMVAFGRFYISNPDLVSRFQNQWPLAESNPKMYYSPGSVGYIDYPKYEN